MHKVTIDQELKNEIKKFWKNIEESGDFNSFIQYLIKRDVYLYTDYMKESVIESFMSYKPNGSDKTRVYTRTYYKSINSLKPSSKTLEMMDVINLRGE